MKTNFERIKEADKEELIKIIREKEWCDWIHCREYKSCGHCIHDYLDKEVDE